MKSELIEKIMISLSDAVIIDIGDLKSRLYMAMNGYSIGREDTEIVVREEDKNEWYF